MSSKTTFELMATHQSYKDVMVAAANASPEELENQGANLRSEMIPELGTYAEAAYKSAGVNEVLIQGCMLYLFYFAVNRDDRRDLFDALLEQLDCSRTQAYRASAVWIHFGKLFLNEPDLRKMFVKESLKILSEDRTPQAARDDALEIARSGKRINMKAAQELQLRHGVADEGKSGNRSRSKRQPKLKSWVFDFPEVRVQLTATTLDAPDVSDLIRDLEQVINKLRSNAGDDVSATTAA